MDSKDISKNSSATWKWGVLLLVNGQWSTCGFFKTEKAAKRFAMTTGEGEFLIARRLTRAEVALSRGM